MAQGPDPDAGLLALRTLTERLADSPSYLSALRDAPPVGQILATVLSRSKLVGQWLERQPEVFKTLADPAALQTQLAPQDYQKVALGLIRRGGGEGEVSAALRRFKRREIARIAVRDLTGRTDPIGVAQELTGLAGACLDATVRLVTDNYDCRLAVIGLGKLGAAELGYASDLDIIVLFDPPGARTSALAGVEQLVRMLSSITPEGQAFAVDLKLRPEGKDGPMARTLDSTVQYYKRWAAPWELFALTQARVVAGDRELGQAMITGIREKVWPKSVDAAYLREIRGMKARLERERAHTASTDALDIKLGPGGLSDIEWTLQLLAVRHALHHRELRQPGVGPVGLAATGCGILSGEEGVWLRQAWLLLTRLRNARYLAGARLTDRVPTDSSSLERLATMLAYDSPGAQNLAEDLTRAMRRVRRVHERHFYGDA
jgi:glutamate-ammonia-ligase adenylyltransferase